MYKFLQYVNYSIQAVKKGFALNFLARRGRLNPGIYLRVSKHFAEQPYSTENYGGISY